MSAPGATLRTFIAVDLDDKLRGEVDTVQRRLNSRIARGLKFVPPPQIHLTLRFLGDVPESRIAEISAALDRACTGTTSIKLGLEGIGCFPSAHKPNVVWLGVVGEVAKLSGLQTKIEHEVGALTDHREDRGFKPHLTIGRVKTHHFREAREIGSVVQSLKIPNIGEWTVAEVVLYKSELGPGGPKYTPLHTGKL